VFTSESNNVEIRQQKGYIPGVENSNASAREANAKLQSDLLVGACLVIEHDRTMTGLRQRIAGSQIGKCASEIVVSLPIYGCAVRVEGEHNNPGRDGIILSNQEAATIYDVRACIKECENLRGSREGCLRRDNRNQCEAADKQPASESGVGHTSLDLVSEQTEQTVGKHFCLLDLGSELVGPDLFRSLCPVNKKILYLLEKNMTFPAK
jgi:hypothetical protein